MHGIVTLRIYLFFCLFIPSVFCATSSCRWIYHLSFYYFWKDWHHDVTKGWKDTLSFVSLHLASFLLPQRIRGRWWLMAAFKSLCLVHLCFAMSSTFYVLNLQCLIAFTMEGWRTVMEEVKNGMSMFCVCGQQKASSPD